jgi:hypothetical protein
MTVKVYDNIPRSYQEAEDMLGTRTEVKLGHETTLHGTAGGEWPIVVKYHDTEILTYYRGGLIIATDGGWDTVTTRRRIKAGLTATHADAIVCDPSNARHRLNARSCYWVAAVRTSVSADEWAAFRAVVVPHIEAETIQPWASVLPLIVDDITKGTDPTALTIAINLAQTPGKWGGVWHYSEYLPAALACVA